MGYNTSYRLSLHEADSRSTIDDAERVEPIVDDLRNRSTEANYCLDEDGDQLESGKWYEHEADLRDFSRRYPDVRFTLHGEGEEAGDLWDKHFLDGRMQVCKPDLRIPPFDPAKLT